MHVLACLTNIDASVAYTWCFRYSINNVKVKTLSYLNGRLDFTFPCVRK